ncbi:hypothetical protein ACFL15_01705 [Patescibacteria group bacterium]
MLQFSGPSDVNAEVEVANNEKDQPTEVANKQSNGTGDVEEVFRKNDALAYPKLVVPDPNRQPAFPDVDPKIARYEEPFEDGDYFEDAHGDIDLPQYYFRVMTAGEIKIAELGVDCQGSDKRGCAAILINHFGKTAMFRDSVVDNGFTVAGFVFDMGDEDGLNLKGMSAAEKVSLAAQTLLDHYIYRMTYQPINDGANCGTIDACPEVEWHVVIVGNGEPQVHWTGLFQR